jgi:hypothetical protein
MGIAGPVPSVGLGVAPELSADGTSVASQDSSDLGLRTALFLESGKCISFTRGELAVVPHESLPVRRGSGRSWGRQLASTFIQGQVWRVVALSL